ncbi:hypothetical protein C8Q76DRAFT_831984 [Earliella scabrosa]|nr:hypothetical protein C8Q76DRAFT_831984 [Earliella scabrosa]
MAHEALQKGDIVYSICAVLTDRSDSGTLARLARVDRLFNECATPVLWRRLKSLLPLFNIFSCFWKIGSGGDQTLSYEIYQLRGISTTEWRRFCVYAAYVHELDVYPASIVTASNSWAIHRLEPGSWVHLTILAHGEPLLPNLRKLQWTVRFVDCPSLQFLITPLLEDLNVNFYPFPRQYSVSKLEWEACITSSLALLSSTAVRLASLRIHLDRQLYLSSVLPLVARLRSLRQFKLFTDIFTSMTTDEIHALSALQELESVTLYGPEHLGFTRPPASLGLPKLRSLTIRHPLRSTGGNPNEVYRMFVHPSSPTPLKELLVQFCPPMALREGCETWTQLYPSLRRFTASLASGYAVEGIQPLAYMIEPMLLLRGIEHFSFYSSNNRGITLADADIVAISRAWPALTNLCIDLHDYPRPTRVPPTRPGFAALVSLATQCPNLEQLRLPFLDLRVGGQAPEGSLGLNSTLSHSRLRELVCGPVVLDDVGEDAPSLAAELVDRLFPSLTMTASGSLSEHSEQDQAVADNFRLALQRRQEARRVGRMRNEADARAT